MRIITYNIHGWRSQNGASNVQQVAQTLQACEGDVIGLNEVYHPTRAGLPASQDALTWLADTLQMNFVFGPCMRWPATHSLPERSYGNALLSRFPIMASAAHHLTAVEGKEQRGLLEARLILDDGQLLTVYVTHLDHTEEDVRLVQLRALRSWTQRDRNRPHIVLGDFNAIQPWDYAASMHEIPGPVGQPNHPLEEEMRAHVIPQMEKIGYTDTMRLAGLAGQGTFIPASAPLRIDYIWVNHSLTQAVHNSAVWQEPPDNEASDHRPVFVDLEL